MAELVPKYLDPSFVRVVNGSVPEVTKVKIPDFCASFSVLTFSRCSYSNFLGAIVRPSLALLSGIDRCLHSCFISSLHWSVIYSLVLLCNSHLVHNQVVEESAKLLRLQLPKR
jgi:hypothetical protein